MTVLRLGFVVSLACAADAQAQERDRTLERIAVALEQPSSIAGGIAPFDSDLPKKLGPLTVVRPMLRGEFVRVSVPVGEWLTGAVRGVAGAHRRRKERAARRKVEAGLTLFEEQRGQKPPLSKRRD